VRCFLHRLRVGKKKSSTHDGFLSNSLALAPSQALQLHLTRAKTFNQAFLSDERFSRDLRLRGTARTRKALQKARAGPPRVARFSSSDTRRASSV